MEKFYYATNCPIKSDTHVEGFSKDSKNALKNLLGDLSADDDEIVDVYEITFKKIKSYTYKAQLVERGSK